jgi:hypothetical protein
MAESSASTSASGWRSCGAGRALTRLTSLRGLLRRREGRVHQNDECRSDNKCHAGKSAGTDFAEFHFSLPKNPKLLKSGPPRRTERRWFRSRRFIPA